ncbi:hypothetical protein JB92DRAFT_3087381 [Gautieria morchelliformis]|nr:hypothetical protein JB92DRAFT_3087381 [Gautieria morchelliformis]
MAFTIRQEQASCGPILEDQYDQTSLLCCFALGEFPKEYWVVFHSFYDTIFAKISLDGNPVQLALWDTACEEPLSYSKSHILIAFSIDAPHSLDNVSVKWMEEVWSVCCKADLRAWEKAQRVAAEIGGRAYKECSALKSEGVDDVFEAATRASMLMREGTKSHDRREPQEDEDGRCCVIC